MVIVESSAITIGSEVGLLKVVDNHRDRARSLRLFALIDKRAGPAINQGDVAGNLGRVSQRSGPARSAICRGIVRHCINDVAGRRPCGTDGLP